MRVCSSAQLNIGANFSSRIALFFFFSSHSHIRMTHQLRTDPAGNIKADKEKSTEKIDGAIATIMGLDRAIRCGNEVHESVYDRRGLLFI